VSKPPLPRGSQWVGQMDAAAKDRALMKWAGHRARDYQLAALFKVEARLANQRRKLRLMEQNKDRLIPTSGPGRRRAKAHRAQGLCLTPVGGRRCPREAVAGSVHCDSHQPETP
jgi:hypothetical protein